MKIVDLDPALKALARIDRVWRTRIEKKMADYAANPIAFANVVKRLQGDDKLRLRVGIYHVLFTEDGVVLLIHAVGHRSDIYRRLT